MDDKFLFMVDDLIEIITSEYPDDDDRFIAALKVREYIETRYNQTSPRSDWSADPFAYAFRGALGRNQPDFTHIPLDRNLGDE